MRGGVLEYTGKMEGMGVRVERVRCEQNLSKTAFARELGIGVEELDAIERGTMPLSRDLTLLLCVVFAVNRLWLESGEGEPFSASAVSPQETVQPEEEAREPPIPPPPGGADSGLGGLQCALFLVGGSLCL
ncbi:helix-turn-helix transcriptional regulator [Treponema pallidum]|uniref:helix-turn-helix domain-containing protein n=1 Tax=Treponema pallidum TaxID=160 RepID=UPI001F2B4108|nr:helix-turn-helix transcriptional regulator [Treponema pallidum]UNE12337.1 helix-turn-helix domain-containing protein [Treponema pallidum]WJS00091.1 helix-turn-helix transcriptional regulator [Treponema pallidum]WPQ92397.1 helix-turn-helix transcriptional regulator [Treponema pallidum]